MMLKICDSVITEPLGIIFKNCIDCGVFPDTWKMSHIIPAHKKNDKRSLNNYCPVSLEDNNLLTHNQSGFRPGDSCVNQLLSIVHIIYLDLKVLVFLEIY